SAPCLFPSLMSSPDTATAQTYPLSLHDALPICDPPPAGRELAHDRRCIDRHLLKRRHQRGDTFAFRRPFRRNLAHVILQQHLARSEEHTSELQSRENLVCRLLLEKKQQNVEQKQ